LASKAEVARRERKGKHTGAQETPEEVAVQVRFARTRAVGSFTERPGVAEREDALGET